MKNNQMDSAPTVAATTELPSVPGTAAPMPPAVSAEEIKQWQAKAALADEHWDKFLRTAAELENYRKRVAREREEVSRAASERVVAALLPVLDNFERALTATRVHDAKNDALLAGLEQILVQMRRTLEQFGLLEVVAHAGQPFDPNVHEAVSQLESAEHAEGLIISQYQRGYKMAERLLRPARVAVSKGAAAKAR